MKTSAASKEPSLIDKVMIFRGEESLKLIPEIEALFAKADYSLFGRRWYKQSPRDCSVYSVKLGHWFSHNTFIRILTVWVLICKTCQLEKPRKKKMKKT